MEVSCPLGGQSHLHNSNGDVERHSCNREQELEEGERQSLPVGDERCAQQRHHAR